jgi:predicted acetyltransferase
MQSEIFVLVKYRAYGVGPYDLQSQYIAYVDIWDLTVQKIPHNREAAATLDNRQTAA